MILKTPYALTLDESPLKNDLQQIGDPSRESEGTLTPFTTNNVRGWLFQPTHGNESLFIVLPKTNIEKVPKEHVRIIAAHFSEGSTSVADLIEGKWLRHPMIVEGQHRDHAVEHRKVLDSWKSAFTYVVAKTDSSVIGLRPPQIGAVHAVHAHWSVTEAPATVVMPTGTGKTETMLSILVSACCERVLVIVPTDALRTQLAKKFLTLGVLKLQDANILAPSALHPIVCVLQHIPKTSDDVKLLFSPAHVIITTSSIVGSCPPNVQQAMAKYCSHLFIDEAHHTKAPTWNTFKNRFSGKRVLQFTATPFREDGKPLDGDIIYVYPLKKAQAEGYFKPIRFLKVVEFNPKQSDNAIAKKAIEQLRTDYSKGHILMARVETVSRAIQVAEIYKRLAPDLEIVQLHTGIKKHSSTRGSSTQDSDKDIQDCRLCRYARRGLRSTGTEDRRIS